MISAAAARQFVLDAVRPLAPCALDLDEAFGCVAAEQVLARESIPGFANSSMDGFALHAEDTASGSARLTIVDAVMAGDVSRARLAAGQAVRIMTGAPLPDGADSVCPIEDVVVEDTSVHIARVVTKGACVRYPGDDVFEGQQLIAPGVALDAPAIAVLAGQGRTTVVAHRRPRVGVISTGNELARSSGPLAPGQIRDANRPLLLALVRESGCMAVDLGIAADTYDEIRQRLTDGLAICDAVISTGGVSVGDVDHVKNVIGELGGSSARSVQVAIKPGKPFAFGVVGPDHRPIFGLPGNPVSTRVGFELFVRPALRTLAGHAVIDRLRVPAVLDVTLARRSDAKLHLVHVWAEWGDDGVVHVRDTARQGSHLLHAIVGANAIALLPDGTAGAVGDLVELIVLDADRLARTA